MKNNSTIQCLNHLIASCKDGEFGFDRCAEYVRSQGLAQLFSNRSRECRSSAQELRQIVIAWGGNPTDDGTALGAVHRGWVALKGSLSGYPDLAMLEECERREYLAMNYYREVLDTQDLPPHIIEVVQRQYQGVRRNHDLIRRARDASRAMSVS